MTMLTADARAPGGIEGSGSVLVVEHTADNNLVTFRFKNKDVKMAAAEDDFELAGHKFRAGAIVDRQRRSRRSSSRCLKDLGLSAWAVPSAPNVKTHDLDLPRIGYIHSWTRTQDEGWWRAALDTFGVPYTYFADQKLREGNLRSKYDVLIFPHVGGSAVSQVNGMPKIGSAPLPYKKTDATPNLGYVDQSDDIRGGMGVEGLVELAKFVQEGGTLITEGSTAMIFPEYGITTGVTVEEPAHAVRARLDPARPDRRHEEPDCLWLRQRRSAGVFQSGAGVERGAAAGSAGSAAAARRRAGHQPECRLRAERDAERGAAAHSTVRSRSEPGARRAGRASGGGRDGAVPPDGAAVRHYDRRHASARRHAVLVGSEQPAAVGHARQRSVPHEPRGGAGPSRRQGARGDVCDPAVLAVADAGHLHARFQRHHELERSRCREGTARGQDLDEPAAVMRGVAQLFDNNRKWAAEMTAARPEFFRTLAAQQFPSYLWIGCSDSRVPANEIVGLLPGELFVHRNVANVVVHTDLNCLSVLQFAVDVLQVKHVIVCGHYGCGGVKAALENAKLGLIDNWLRHVQDVRQLHAAEIDALAPSAQLDRLCELNVLAQARHVGETTIVQDALRAPAAGAGARVDLWAAGRSPPRPRLGRLVDVSRAARSACESRSEASVCRRCEDAVQGQGRRLSAGRGAG